MGICGSSLDPTTKAINDAIKYDNRSDAQINKLLLLGAGGSGKSTVFKQLKSIHGTGITKNERMSYKSIVIGNVIDFMRTLCKQAQRLSAEVQECAECMYAEANQQAAEAVIAYPDLGMYSELEDEIASAIVALWNDPGIKKTFDERSRFQMQDSAAYFFDQRMDDIRNDDYEPTEKDVLMARVRTTGIIEQEFVVDQNKFKVFDVGGQRNERKKWIHCFENVTAVIFVASLSGYDQMLLEDVSTNRMKEALDLFAQINDPTGTFGTYQDNMEMNANQRIVSNKREYMKMGTWFIETAMIVFLNKSDLFEQKVMKKPLNKCPYFKDYKYNKSKSRFEHGVEYIRSHFERRNKTTQYNGHQKNLYCHVTNATDKGIIRKVFNDVQHLILSTSLQDAGIM